MEPNKEIISKLKFICKIASEAYEKLPEKIGIDETERSVCSKLKIDLIERGADLVLFMASGLGKAGYDQIVFNPSKHLNFEYDFSIDNNLDKTNYNLLKAGLGKLSKTAPCSAVPM